MKLKLLLLSFFAMTFSLLQAQSTIEITTSGGSFPGEKWVSITDMANATGTVIWDQGGMPFDSNYGGNAGYLTNEVVNLAPGTYWVNCYDQYGDSWDGSVISVTAFGSVIGDNGGVSPDDGIDTNGGFGWGNPRSDELEASFMIVVPSPPTCLPPTGITVGNIGAGSADISWNAVSNAVDYDVVVVNQGDGSNGTPVFQDSMATGTMVTATGLTASSNYDVFITTNCGAADGVSAIEGPISFFQGVESTIEITTSGGSFANEKWVSITDMADGAGTVIWDQGGMPFGSNYGGNAGLLANEVVTLAPGTYWVNCYDAYDDGWDGTTISVTAYSSIIGDNGGVSPSDGNDEDATFAFGDTQAQELEASFMIVVPQPPTCLPATNITVANITADSADVSWDAVSNAVDYDVVVVLQGSGSTGTPVFQDSMVTGLSVTATGLSPAEQYDVFVTTNCGATDGLSTAGGPATFITACPAIFSAPYSTDFEDFTAAAGGITVDGTTCWNETSSTTYAWNADSSGGTGSSNTGPSAAFSGNTFIYSEASNGSVNDIASIESPSIDLSALSVPALYFYYHMYGAGISSLDIYVSDDAGATFTLVSQIVGQQQMGSAEPWIQSILDLSPYSNQTIIVKFETTKITPATGFDFEGDVSIDDFKINEAPPCLSPANLVATNAMFDSTAGTASVDLAWTAGGPTQNLFDIVIVPEGSSVTGSTAPTNPGITGTSTTIGNLTPGIRYEAYVRADCGAMDGVSFYAGPAAFRTPGPGDNCAEPISINVEPDCATATPFNLDLTNAVDLGTGFASCAGTGPNFGAWFEFNVGRGQSSITVNASEASSFAIFDACSGNELRCGTLTATESADLGDLDARTDYKLVVWSSSRATPSVDICLEEGPDCVAPYDLELISAVVDNAIISWTPGETFQTTFNVLIFDAGADPTVDAPVIDDMGVTTIPYTASPLMQGQFYDFYVVSDCSNGANTDLSESSGPLTFKVEEPGESCLSAVAMTVNTDCTDPTAMTYTVDFSQATTIGANDASCKFGSDPGVWVEFVAPAVGSVRVSFDSMGYALFDGCNGNELICSDPFSGTNSTGAIIDLIPGQTYKMALWETFGSGATSTICIEEGPDCSPLIPDYAYSFDNYIGDSPGDCWAEGDDGDIVNGPATTGSSVWGQDGFGNNGTTGSARINIYTTNRDGWILTPEFDLTAGGYELNVDVALTDFASTNQGTFDLDDRVVLVYTEDGVTWTELNTWNSSNQPTNTGDAYNVALPTTGSSVQFGFYADSGPTNPGFEDNDFFVDNFQIRTIPSCPDTRDLSIDSFTNTTASISFESGSTSSSGDFEYAVTAPGAGTPTMATGAWNDAAAVGQANPMINYTIMGLSSNTEYDVYVREICAPGDVSAWSRRPQFLRTACDTFVPRYFEAFDNYVGDIPADCWSEATGGDEVTGPAIIEGSLWIEDGFANAGSTGSAKFNIYTTNRSGWIVSPVFDLSAGGYQLNVDVALTEFASTVQGNFDLDDKVVLIYTEDNGVTWTELKRWEQNGEPAAAGETYNTLLSSTGSSVQFAFYADSGPTNPGFEDNDFFVDNFEVRDVPTCPDILDFQLFSFTSTTATITLESGSASSSGNFEYAVTAPGAGIPAAATGSWSDAAAVGQANPMVTYTIPGLMASTGYDLYVREVCAPNDESLFAGSISIVTECEAISSYPHSTNFTTNLDPTTCWDEGEGGDVTTGILSPGTSEWKEDDYLDAGGNVIESSALNLFGNSTVNWLVTESFDLTGTSSASLNITTALTAFDDPSTPSGMGSDDTVQLVYLDQNDPNASWIQLDVWQSTNDPMTTNEPDINGSASSYNLDALSGGVYRFAFIGSTNASDLEDYDFHVSQFTVDATASNSSMESSVFALYPNPVTGDTLNISISGAQSGDYGISIYNSMGQQIMTQTIESVSNTIRVDGLQGLASGMYFISIKGNAAETTLKFLKN